MTSEIERIAAEAKALAEAKGFKYWPGGDGPPDDWDGGPYLCRDGKTYHMAGYDWRHGTGAWVATADWDRIGYRPRAHLEKHHAE